MSYGYIEGYRRAGDILSDYVYSTSRFQDTLIYPILFCYRHHLELRLKEIIRSGRMLLDEGTDYDDGHSLVCLWNTSKKVIIKVIQETPNEINLIDHFISEIDQIDASSDAFRYWETSKNKQRKKHLIGIRHIDIRNYRECMENIADFLDTISFGYNMLIDRKNDQEL